ncbi:MAG: GntR family transcriptional regulator [Lachnospiraceae bacterium]|nr:GntR family transcriptional regulator [Lachnospiraceae bacterium]
MADSSFKIEINFDSEEAYYMQIRNQVIAQIAYGKLEKGEQLPSVRQLAEEIGINMHTVNKAYSLLRREGYVKIDRRSGAKVDVEYRQDSDIKEISEELYLLVAKARCKGISKETLLRLVDEHFAQGN